MRNYSGRSDERLNDDDFDQGSSQIIRRMHDNRQRQQQPQPPPSQHQQPPRDLLMFGNNFQDTDNMFGADNGSLYNHINRRRQQAAEQEDLMRRLGATEYNRQMGTTSFSAQLAYDEHGEPNDEVMAHMRRKQMEAMQVTHGAPVSGNIETDPRLLGVEVTGDSMLALEGGPLDMSSLSTALPPAGRTTGYATQNDRRSTTAQNDRRSTASAAQPQPRRPVETTVEAFQRVPVTMSRSIPSKVTVMVEYEEHIPDKDKACRLELWKISQTGAPEKTGSVIITGDGKSVPRDQFPMFTASRDTYNKLEVLLSGRGVVEATITIKP